MVDTPLQMRTERDDRREVAMALLILSLTAELLAIDLRNIARTTEQIRGRSLALGRAKERVARASLRIPARRFERNGNRDRTLADDEPLRTIRALAHFIDRHAQRSDVDRDVLAEYVDILQNESTSLLEDINLSQDY